MIGNSKRRGRVASSLVLAAGLLGLLVTPSAAQLRFASLGNWGYQSDGQQEVADSLKKYAETERIGFIVSPGSNFAGGVSALNDTLWETAFEKVYTTPDGSLKVPFFTVLGVEDWAKNYTAEALRTQESYSEEKKEDLFPKWMLPNWWYHHLLNFPANTGGEILSAGYRDMSVGFIFIDTWILSQSFPFSNITEKAWKDLDKMLEVAPKVVDYIIVVGDRPIYSSGGSKGDSYLEYYLLPLLKKAQVDAYVAGYDYDMEAIEVDGISHIMCGSGSMGGSNALSKNSYSLFFSGKTGFCLHELNAKGMVTKFVDGHTGDVLYTHETPLVKRKERSTVDAYTYKHSMPEVEFVEVPTMGKMPGRDVFVRVVGTIGLAIATALAILGAVTGASRVMK